MSLIIENQWLISHSQGLYFCRGGYVSNGGRHRWTMRHHPILCDQIQSFFHQIPGFFTKSPVDLLWSNWTFHRNRSWLPSGQDQPRVGVSQPPTAVFKNKSHCFCFTNQKVLPQHPLANNLNNSFLVLFQPKTTSPYPQIMFLYFWFNIFWIKSPSHISLWIQVPPKKIQIAPKLYPFRAFRAVDPWIHRVWCLRFPGPRGPRQKPWTFPDRRTSEMQKAVARPGGGVQGCQVDHVDGPRDPLNPGWLMTGSLYWLIKIPI